jgi:2',3'-cyclic-nucleotide 2'-phosphodiesterase (5'-nucleotidase family)
MTVTLGLAIALGATRLSGQATGGLASGEVTLIHIGDIHGHLVPRPDATVASRRSVGGLARMATVIDRIRRERGGRALLVNVGDAVQGSAEALFTRGQAVVDLLALLRVDAYVPGNWD